MYASGEFSLVTELNVKEKIFLAIKSILYNA